MKLTLRQVYNELNMSYDALQRLARLLDRTSRGSDEVYLSPIGNNTKPEVVLQGWDNIFKSNLSSMNKTLLDLEEGNRSKYGPRSIAIRWSERQSGLDDAFSDDKGRKIESNLPDSGRLRPITRNSAVKYIKLQTSAGLPTMLKKGLVLNETLDRDWVHVDPYVPCVPFTRTQDQKKTRLVWGYPLQYILNEMQFYRPILEYQSKLPWRAALRSADDTDLSVTSLINHARSTGKVLMSIDFSNYDNSVKKSLQEYAFNDYFPSLFQREFKHLIVRHGDRFNNIPIITPEEVRTGSHGIPSGSAYTNEVGSVVQYGISQTFNEVLNFSQIQGDDGAYATLDPEGLKDHFRSYGLAVNDDKSYISDDFVIYLQNLYHTDYIKDGLIRGIYPTYRALGRIVYQERFNDFSEDDISGKDYYAIRTLSILENCKAHPLFRELVEYVVKLDKYNLNFSDQGLSAYIKMREKQDGRDIKFTEYRRGDGFGIKSFESYKIAREFIV